MFLPLLRLAGDGREHSLAASRDTLATLHGLSDAELRELLPSGRQSRFANRVAWAKVYLEQAGLLSTPRRGHFVITDRGMELLQSDPQAIDIALLERYEEFREFRRPRSRSRNRGVAPREAELDGTAEETPEETMERAYQSMRAELAAELLSRMRSSSPAFFERLVVDVLLAMGYGRSRAEAGRAIGKSGDEGIDGIISEDRLGLDTIYIQAKRWEGSVGRPEIQKFVGALHGRRARKGVFMTTGTFTAEAIQYVSHIDPRVVLIDGRELAEYMMDLGLGVTTRGTFEVKRVDSDYFEE